MNAKLDRTVNPQELDPHTVRYSFKGDLGDLIWSSPAAAGDKLLFRGVKGLYCVTR